MKGGDQVIPRPPEAQPGGPPPWAVVPAPERARIGLDRVVAALAGPVPDPPVAGPAELLAGGRRPAAVLVALFEEGGQARVVLTRRSGHLRAHRHEISFPGGRLEPGETPEAGARREAAEEVGLDPALPVTIGRLTPMVTVSSMNWMVPVVATLPGRPALQPNPAEVARAFDVPLADLAADDVFREERWPVRLLPAGPDGRPVGAASGAAAPAPSASYPVWFFELEGETVWGATARVLVELLTRVLVRPG